MKHNKFWANKTLFLVFIISFPLCNFVFGQMGDYRQLLNDHPEELIYMHTDRDVFYPGTEVRFKAYIVCKRPELKKSEKLEVVLMNYLGEEMLRSSFPIENNTATGIIKLDPELNIGEYTIKYFTSRSLRAIKPGLFERKIIIKDFRIPTLRIALSIEKPIYKPGDLAKLKIEILTLNGKAAKYYSFDYAFSQNGNIFRFGEKTTDRKGQAELYFNIPEEEGLSLISAQISSDFNGVFHSNSIVVPTTNWPVLLSFCPEGGRFIEGFKSKVVFNARNVFGQPMDIKGVLIDDFGSVVDSISTAYPGIGCFTINPDIGNPHIVKLIEPYETHMEFPLPEIQDEGIILDLDHQSKEEVVFTIDYNLDIDSLELQLIAVSGSSIVWEEEITIEGEAQISVPVKELPNGIIRFSLLSDDFGFLAQRPVFIRASPYKLDVQADLPENVFREKGEIVIGLADEENKVADLDLSISMVDDIISPDWQMNHDIYSAFLHGSSLTDSPFPPGYIQDNQSFDKELFDLFMISQVDPFIFWSFNFNDSDEKSDEELLDDILDSENPGAMQQLLTVLRTDQFNEKYILNRGETFLKFMDVNHNELEELELVPGQMTEDQMINRLLERGTSLMTIVKTLQPVYLANGMIYFRAPVSLAYQPPVLIVMDGIIRGSLESTLKEIDTFSVDSLRIHTTISDILKYGGLNSAGGIIEIVSKKGNSDIEKEKFQPREIYEPTLLWYPDLQSGFKSKIRIDLPYPRLRTTHRLVIQGIDSSGNPIYYRN